MKSFRPSVCFCVLAFLSVSCRETQPPAGPRSDEITSVALVKSPIPMRGIMPNPSSGQRGRAIGRWGAQASFLLSAGAGPAESAAEGPVGRETSVQFKENDFVSPEVEPLSTFSIDVDTASYSLARRYLTQQRRLPPRESVRLEEFVNYFSYADPAPEGDEPFAVTCELGAAPWAPAHKLLRVALQSRTLAAEKLPPCNLVFLIDVSGSMADPDKLPLLQQAFRLLVEQLRPQDRVAIVTYASGVGVRLEPTAGSEKKILLDAIGGLVAAGATSGGEGLRLAYETARKHFDPAAVNRVILATDGDFNVGPSSDEELVSFIEKERESGVFLTVLGFGTGNYQGAKMKKLADAGNGNYAYVDGILEARKVLVRELGATLHAVAKDVKIQLEFNPERVAAYRLLGYETRLLRAQDFNDDRKDAGELGAGHHVTAFYELVPAGADAAADPAAPPAVDPLRYTKRETTGSGELLTLKLRHKAPDGDESRLREQSFAAEEIERVEPSEDFRFGSAVAEVALLLRDSAHKGAADYGHAIERARAARGADEDGLRAEFVRLAETAQLLAR